MTVDYAAILAGMVTVDNVVSKISDGLRLLLIQAGIEPVVFGPTADNAPDSVVVLTPYPLVDNVSAGSVLLGIQVRIRGGAKAGAKVVVDRSETILLILSQLVGVEIATGATVATCYRNSSSPVTTDTTGRPYISDSYYLRTDRRGTEK